MIIPGKLRSHIKLQRLDKQRNGFGEIKLDWLTVIDRTWAEISDPTTTRHEDSATSDDLSRSFLIRIRNRDSLRSQDLFTDLRITILDGAHKNVTLEVSSLEETITEIEMEASDSGRH